MEPVARLPATMLLPRPVHRETLRSGWSSGHAMPLGALLCGSLPWMCSKEPRAARAGRFARLKFNERIRAVQKYTHGEMSEEFDTGVSTGYKSLDEYFRPVRGEVITLSGQPGSGKSEFVLSMALNIAERKAWKIGLCLFEHKADQLFLQLLEKRKRMNFNDLDSLSMEDQSWLTQHFQSVTDFSEEMDLDQILERAERLAEDGNLQMLIIDPYNYIAQPPGLGKEILETHLVSTYMTKLQQFAKKYKVCVLVVVHPTKQSQIAGGDPSLYDMQGSANWYNKCDKGLILRRANRDPDAGSTHEVEIYIKKVRNGDSGKVGMTKLEFQPKTRCYKEIYVAA